MDGWEFLEEYKKLQSKLSQKIDIYLISSSVSPINVVRAKYINTVSDYLIKPINNAKLKDIIGKL